MWLETVSTTKFSTTIYNSSCAATPKEHIRKGGRQESLLVHSKGYFVYSLHQVKLFPHWIATVLRSPTMLPFLSFLLEHQTTWAYLHMLRNYFKCSLTHSLTHPLLHRHSFLWLNRDWKPSWGCVLPSLSPCSHCPNVSHLPLSLLPCILRTLT